VNGNNLDLVQRYSIAVLSVSVATLAGLLLEPELQRHLPFVWFFGALTFTAWYAGFRPAVMATVLSGALAAYIFLPPDRSLEVEELVDQLALCIFLMIGMAIALYSRRVAMLRTAVRAQRQEWRIARQIQQGLLPREIPIVTGFRIAGRSLPAHDVGGDCFDFIPLGGKREYGVALAIADASGHGIGSALVIAETRAYFRALAATCADVGRILTLTNRRLAEELPSDFFVTAFLAALDTSTRSLVFANAGHCPGYVLDRGGRIEAVLESSGMPLGIDIGSEYLTSPPITLSRGDIVVAFSDGLVEAPSPGGRQFGTRRVIDVVRAHTMECPNAILSALLETVSRFSRSSFQLDDMTAVVVKVVEDSSTGSISSSHPVSR
jgi:serine phosphatase RsbU (regulator of sigma subunit)